MSRLTNDIDAINQAVSQNVTSLLAGVLSLIGILVAMFVLDMWLALASFLVVPIMFAFTEFVARYTRLGFRELQKHLGELNGVMEEAISGQKVVRAFRRNESAIDLFRRSNQEVFRAAVWANSYAFLLMPLTNVLGNFFVIVLAGLGGWLALQGLVSVGIIATFINYAQNFISPLRQLANMYNSIQAALAGAERVFEIIDTPAEADDAPDAAPLEAIRGEVRFDHVNFGYRPGTPIIKDMTLEVRAGETLALVGPTGAGKTTLINLLTRFYEIDSGRITIDGKDIRSIRKADLRRRLGIVLQETFLFSGTVMENIRYGRLAATDEDCIAAARMAGADPFIRQLANGYRTHLSERAGNLSQGTAAAFVHRPCDSCRPGHHDPRRGDQQCRYPDRGPHPKGIAATHGGTHEFRDRPPPEHHPRCRAALGDRQRRNRRKGDAPGTAHPPRLLPPLVPQPVQGTGDLNPDGAACDNAINFYLFGAVWFIYSLSIY